MSSEFQGMERRQMALQQHPSSSSNGGFHHAFHASMAATVSSSSADFGGCHSVPISNGVGAATAQQQSSDHHNRVQVAKSVKQELLLGSPQQQQQQRAQQQQQNGFHPHMGGDSNGIDQLALASGCGGDFFSPAALQHFLLPQLSNTDFVDQQQHQAGTAKDNAANNFNNNFCAASASTAPADPQPSISNATAKSAEKRTKANGSSGQHQHSSTGTARTGDRKRPYPCSLCASRFGSKMELEEHQNSHTGQKPFQCDVCQSRFNRRSTLWNHKRIHSDAKPFVCTICHMQFKWKNSLKCHKEMHSRKNELPHVLPDSETHALTYATAAKKKMGELTGADPASITLLSASNASSHLLTCAGTPRKRAPARPKGSGGGGSKSKSTASSKVAAVGRLPSNGQLGHQQHSTMARQPACSGKSSSVDEAKAAQQRLRVEGSRHMENGGGGTTATATATPIGGLDFARFHCGPSSLNGGIPSSLHQQQQQQQFLHFDPLIRTGQSGAAYEQQLTMDGLQQQQMGPPDLLMNASCNGGGQSSAVTVNNNLQLQLGDPTICCSLLQDFPSQQCFVDQQSRPLPTANFLGFDLNSLAGIQPGTDPNSCNSLLSTSVSSVQFPVGGQFMAQQQQSTGGFAGCSAAVVSSSSNSVLNNYQFDPASVRFLAAAAEMSQQQQHSSASSNDQQQQQVMTTADYGLFCYGQPYMQQQQGHQQRHGGEDSRTQQQQQLLFSEGGHFMSDQLALDSHIIQEQLQHQQQFMNALAHEQQHMGAMAVGNLVMPTSLAKDDQQTGPGSGGGVITAMSY